MLIGTRKAAPPRSAVWRSVWLVTVLGCVALAVSVVRPSGRAPANDATQLRSEKVSMHLNAPADGTTRPTHSTEAAAAVAAAGDGSYADVFTVDVTNERARGVSCFESPSARFGRSVGRETNARASKKSRRYAKNNESSHYKYPFLYGVSTALLVEPHHALVLAISLPLARAAYAWTFEDGATSGGSSIRVSPDGTDLQTLSVVETVEGAVTRSQTFTVYVKYVRRELRQLSREDRERFLDVAATMLFSNA